MGNLILRNVHAQFFGDPGDKKILVYFETHMDSAWNLNPLQLPPQGTIINSDLTLKFDVMEVNKGSEQTFQIKKWDYIYPVALEANYKHVTTVYLFHSQGADKESVGTIGDPT